MAMAHYPSYNNTNSDYFLNLPASATSSSAPASIFTTSPISDYRSSPQLDDVRNQFVNTSFLSPNATGHLGGLSRQESYHTSVDRSKGYVSPKPPASADTSYFSITAPSVPGSHRSSTTSASSLAPATTPAIGRMSTPTNTLDPTQKRALITALNEHRINTLGELRRIERVFADMGSPDLTQPMTAAWTYYVNSHSLLNELRQACSSFSSECLDEAKRRVYRDPASNRSWNLCWLVLTKIQSDSLIQEYARNQAVRPEMWGGQTPSVDAMERLVRIFERDWSAALARTLKYWDKPPMR